MNISQVCHVSVFSKKLTMNTVQFCKLACSKLAASEQLKEKKKTHSSINLLILSEKIMNCVAAKMCVCCK